MGTFQSIGQDSSPNQNEIHNEIPRPLTKLEEEKEWSSVGY